MKGRNYKVLVPVDFSETSRTAVKYVLRTFYHNLSHLYLLHAYKENAENSAPMITLIDILREKSERLMQQELARVDGMNPPDQLEVVGYSRFETLVPAIQSLLQDAAIDLVVMGVQQPAQARYALVSEGHADILQQINLPVLLVPKIAN